MTNKMAKTQLIQLYGRKCMLCKCKFKLNLLTFHHIKPKSYGGQATVENGALICEKCHKLINKSEFLSSSYFDLTLEILNNKEKFSLEKRK